jgi:isochorismate synthase
LIVSEKAIAISSEQVFNQQIISGYVIAPFSFQKTDTVFLARDFEVGKTIDYADFDRIKAIKGQKELNRADSFYADYNAYQKQYQELYSFIEKGEVKKAILSRVKHIQEFPNAYASEFYYQLESSYASAYTFMYYTPQTGLWAGASPELFLTVNDYTASTVSLAGTQRVNSSNLNWNSKELDEQQIVTDFVTSVLQKYKVNNPDIKGPISIEAGKMTHLKTMYSFSTEHVKKNMAAFIQDLHPTPAVCGLPKKESMEIIHKVEQHQRMYYSGFLGRVDGGEMDLFVNIRSMKFTNGGVDLYLGGGITLNSNVLDEWNETELKAETLQSVIEKTKVIFK